MISNTLTAIRLVLMAPLLALLSQTGAIERWWALAVLLLAGLTDVLDGRVARALGEVSRVGALLDLVADRLLSLAVVAGLLASGELPGAWMAAAVALVARDLTVASFGEAAPGLGIKVTALERVKIALQFAAFGLLCAPRVVTLVDQYEVGRWALAASAALAAVTVALYARRVGPQLA
jgi:phosphatidylglycerophosphate synthase